MPAARARNFGRRVWAFFRAPRARKRLGVEAVLALMHARVLTWMRATTYVKYLGDMQSDEPALAPDALAVARDVGHVVAITARGMPFRALCLQQAIAVRILLKRRAIPATVHLGLARKQAAQGQDGSSQAAPEPGYAAHAWVTSGGHVINGEIDLENYTVVGSFS